MLRRTHGFLGQIINSVGFLCAILMLLMVLNVFIDVVMRYLFNNVSIGMQELEWHLFSAMFLLGIGYTLKENAHVRVDVAFEHFSLRVRAAINIIGTVVFLIPFCAVVAFYGLDFLMESYQLGEKSGDPGGLYFRWLIKGTIPLAFAFTILCGIYVIIDQLLLISPRKPDGTGSSAATTATAPPPQTKPSSETDKGSA